MKIYLILLTVLFIRPTSSQTAYIDTLKNRLVAASSDSDRVKVYYSLAYMTSFFRPDSALLVAQRGLDLARKIGFVKGGEYCKFAMAVTMWNAGEYSTANEFLAEALKYALSVGDASLEIEVYWKLCTKNRDQGNFAEGLKYAYKAIETAIAKNGGSYALGVSYLEIGAIYQEMNNLDSALYYLNKVNIPVDTSASGFYGFKYLMFGHIFGKKGNYSQALLHYKRSVEICYAAKDYKDLSLALNSIAKLYQQQGEIDSAKYYAKNGFDIANTALLRKGIYEAGLLLANLYEKEDPGLALNYLRTATAARDSMFNLQKTVRYLNNQFEEQTRQREAAANKIQYQNKIRIYILLTILAFSLVLGIILFRNNRHKQRSNLRLEKAYAELKAS